MNETTIKLAKVLLYQKGINMSALENNVLILSKADEEELRIAYDLFRSDRPLTEEEEMVLYDPTKDQIPTLAQVRKRQEKYRYRSPFSKPPKVLTDIPLTPPE
ncbi:MAG: hypothetical protein ABFS56_11415 [Pseudomonadota bacterium]